MHTPNMDRLAREGVLFRNAYAQYSLCAPSRSSFLTGRRPDTTRVLTNKENFRTVGEAWRTLPGYFKEMKVRRARAPRAPAQSRYPALGGVAATAVTA